MIYQLPDGFTTRSATPDDAGSVAALWNARSEAFRGEQPSTSERVLKIWDHPKFDLATDSRLVFAPHDVLIGYAHRRVAEVRRLLGIPDTVHPMAVVAAGSPVDRPEPADRYDPAKAK